LGIALTLASIKLLFVKRTPEAAHRTEASGLADGLAEMLVSFLQPAEAIKGVQIDTVAVGLAAVLLFDGMYKHRSCAYARTRSRRLSQYVALPRL
jgi:hypothetical protein